MKNRFFKIIENSKNLTNKKNQEKNSFSAL